MRTSTGARWRGPWIALALFLFATAAFVPIRIAYKRNQTHDAAPGEVVIENFTCSPGSLQVAKGTKIIFRNADGAAHTVTATDKSFDSGRLDGGDVFEVEVAASISYFCDIHQYMTGTIDVAS